MTPRVSIIVPSHNHARFLPEAIGSAAAQDWPEMELICVDDASTDDSAQVLERLLADAQIAARFQRIELLRHASNQDAPATINRGVAASTGELVNVLNSDDVFAPDRLARMVPRLLEADAALAFSSVVAIDAEGRTLTEDRLPPELAGKLGFALGPAASWPTLGFACFAMNLAISSGNLLFTRALFDRIGGFRAMRHVHDWDFLLRSVRVAEPVFCPRPLYRYRLHGANSFPKLAAAGEQEMDRMASEIALAKGAPDAPNPLYPCEEYWPGIFKLLAPKTGLLARIS
jgi:glycosyltransferase involved in cell wall biosynthesis